MQSLKNNEEISILSILDTILDRKKLIAATTVCASLAGISYALLSTPIYKSDLLIQVEKNEAATGIPIQELSSLFNVQSQTTAEIEIIKSRKTLNDTIEKLNLNIETRPKYIPVIGEWLAKQSSTLSNPGIFGIGGYLSGNEKIFISKYEIEPEYYGKIFTITKTEDGFILEDDKSIKISEGKIKEETALINNGVIIGKIKIDELESKIGGQFEVKQTSKLTTTKLLQESLSIAERGFQSGIINITLEGKSPEKTADILNTIGTVYVDQNTERKSAEAQKTLNFLDNFLPEIKKQLTQSEENYTKFRNNNKTFDLTLEGKSTLETGVTLELKKIELEQKKKELERQFTSAHPAIKTINQQITNLKNETKELEEKSRTLPSLEQELLNLSRNVKVNNELYVNLLNSAQQLRLVKEGKVGNVRVIDKAYVPELADKPKKALIILSSTILGLIIGIIIALINKTVNRSVTTAEEIENELEVSVFSTIPRSNAQESLFQKINKKESGKHVLAKINPQDPSIESLKSLRTALQFALLKTKQKVILITGPAPSIGKSFISVNFSTVLAQSGKKILLIDGDLRKGYANQYFGLDRKKGFSEILSESISINEAIHSNVEPNLDFISTGILPPNPSELLSVEKISSIIRDIGDKYDLIIIDSPPILAVSDALPLISILDTVFVVARSESTTLPELIETKRRIEQIGGKITGIILNDVTPRSRRYGYNSYQYINYEYQNKE